MESRPSLYKNTEIIFNNLSNTIRENEDKTNIILLAGFPGAGKSTIITELSKYIPFFLISGDRKPSVSCESNTEGIFNCQKYEDLIQIMLHDIDSDNLRLGNKPILIDKPFVSNAKTKRIDEGPEIYLWLDAFNNRFPNAKIYIIYLDIPWHQASRQAWIRFENDRSRGIIPAKVYKEYNEIAENLYKKDGGEISGEREEYDITVIPLEYAGTGGKRKRKRKTKRKTKHKIRKNKKTRRINHKNRK